MGIFQIKEHIQTIMMWKLALTLLVVTAVNSAPGEESQAPSQPAPAAPASPPAEANYAQDQQQVNAGEEANKAMEKTKSELNEKVKAIEMELEKAKEEANKKTVGRY